MRPILALCTIALLICGRAHAQDFTAEFREVFNHSIKGLSDWVKDSKPVKSFGAIPGTQEIAKDPDLDVLVFQSTQSYPSASDADAAKLSLESLVEKALPAGQFSKRTSYSLSAGCMKTIFEFKSDKMAEQQKRPTVEVYMLSDDTTSSVIIRIAEPYFKNQYTPNY